jgi:hypothetical protein
MIYPCNIQASLHSTLGSFDKRRHHLMKKSKFLIVFILIFTLLGSACGAKTPAPTSKPPLTPTEKSTIQIPPSPTSTPEVLTERLGHVWVPPNALAGYVFRSFLQIPVGMTWGPDGYLYIADWAGRHIVRVARDGTMDDLPFWKTVMPLQYDGPRSVAFDSQGNLFTNNHGTIFRVDTSGEVTELQGIQAGPIGSIAINAADELYYTDRAENQGALPDYPKPSWLTCHLRKTWSLGWMAACT